MRLSAIIPARLGAQRLPGKPLADICGKPMVVRVAEATQRAAGIDAIVASSPIDIASPPSPITATTCRPG